VFAVTTWSLLLTVIAPAAVSRSSLTTDQFTQVIKLSAQAVPTAIVSIAFIKISVACLLLRFQQDRAGRLFLNALIGIIIATHAGFVLFNLLRCIPLSAIWDTSIQGAKCVSNNSFRIVSNATTGVNIATDVLLSLFPITFLRQIRRPLQEKILIGLLMAMGMTAAGASVAKAVLVREWATAADSFSIGFQICTFTCVEIFLGIIAACSPCFKPHVQRLLTSMGLDFIFHRPRSFFRSIHSSSLRKDAPSGTLQEFNTHSGGTAMNHALSFNDLEGLSKETSKVGVDGLGSGSEQEVHCSTSSDGSR
jgi:Fungal rhodopsin domain